MLVSISYLAPLKEAIDNVREVFKNLNLPIFESPLPDGQGLGFFLPTIEGAFVSLLFSDKPGHSSHLICSNLPEEICSIFKNISEWTLGAQVLPEANLGEMSSEDFYSEVRARERIFQNVQREAKRRLEAFSENLDPEPPAPGDTPFGDEVPTKVPPKAPLAGPLAAPFAAPEDSPIDSLPQGQANGAQADEFLGDAPFGDEDSGDDGFWELDGTPFEELDPEKRAKWFEGNGLAGLPDGKPIYGDDWGEALLNALLKPYRAEGGNWEQKILEPGDQDELMGVLIDEILKLDKHRTRAFMELGPDCEKAVDSAISKEIQRLIMSVRSRLRNMVGLPDVEPIENWNEFIFSVSLEEAMELETMEKAQLAGYLELDIAALKAQGEDFRGAEMELSQTKRDYSKALGALRKAKGDKGYAPDESLKPREPYDVFMDYLKLKDHDRIVPRRMEEARGPLGQGGLGSGGSGSLGPLGEGSLLGNGPGGHGSGYNGPGGHGSGNGGSGYGGPGREEAPMIPIMGRVEVNLGADDYSRAAVNLFGKNVYEFLQPKERITLDSAVGLLKVMGDSGVTLPCFNVVLFPFARVFEGFVTKLMLLRMDVNLAKYQRDHREFPTEAYVHNKALGRFIVGQTHEYPVLDRLIKVWKGLRCLETRVTPLPDPELDALVTWPLLEEKISELADLMKDLYRLFAQVSTRDFDRELYINDPFERAPNDTVFHSQMATPAGQKFIPTECLDSGEDEDCSTGPARANLARPIYPFSPCLEASGKPPRALGSGSLKGHDGDKTIQTPGVRIGTDESGKGDYFGPLVVAGVYVNQEIEEKLLALGLKDSKANSDSRNLALAKQIKEIVGPGHFYVVKINPSRYNQLYSKLKNLNDILAWAHATAIESLLAREICPFVIVDQFAKEELLKARLKKVGQAIEIFQTPRAERDVAVAAASILARESFLTSLEALGQPFGFKLLKGASNMVDLQIKEIGEKHGLEALEKLGKLHFKNTAKAGVVLK
ncbi:MAG: ribonuclease HIII [Deltaproteobacteria bacterium]|jgi:ribonuclease HIII|nr:ribonuclease HIII [Deltaproteobacteria bacterium]